MTTQKWANLMDVILDDFKGNDKIRPWAYDTTDTLVWFPPSEYRPKKESVEKPDSIWLLKSGRPSVFHGKRMFLRNSRM